MKHDARRDANELSIVRALEAIGCTVQRLSGGGLPDLMVGRKGDVALLEVKMQGEKLNALQQKWHKWWQGGATIVTTPQEAVAAVLGEECPF